MISLGAKLKAATNLLRPVTDTPRVDAEILLAHALGISRAQLLTRLKTVQPAPSFAALVERRLCYEPIAYIVGEWEFFSLSLVIEPPVLVPRPETEHLVEAVLDFVGSNPARVLDIGTGSGCVAVAVACNNRACEVVATDISTEALELARRNVARHELDRRIRLYQGDLFDALPAYEGRFDVVCSNPPYVEEDAWPDLSPVIRLHEDPRALLAGKDGLDIVRQLVVEAPPHLRPGGLLAVEIGMGQHETVRDILVQHGYEPVRFRRDLAGIERIATALWRP